ncbi:MAG: LysM peptidoglycan-binding domain-containing protein [Nitriliruptorales bacterium]|nr:LysM peptidoglycan-binding domain-containing protein [Nitriliruptorales bacterium]
MDHDYELEEDYAPRVLWGRIAFFVLALLLAFLVGRCTTSDGADPQEFAERGQQIAELTRQNEVLEAQLQASGASEPADGGGKKKDDGADDEPTEESVSGDGEKYTVQSGDTLNGIAKEFYGDAAKYTLITDANNLSQDTPLRVGQELIIPPDE